MLRAPPACAACCRRFAPRSSSIQLHITPLITPHNTRNTQRTSPYCIKAKNALRQFTTNFHVVELDQRGDGDAVQDALLELTGARSVPRVFVGGNFIGGGDDTAAKAANGQLQALLRDAGAL